MAHNISFCKQNPIYNGTIQQERYTAVADDRNEYWGRFVKIAFSAYCLSFFSKYLI